MKNVETLTAEQQAALAAYRKHYFDLATRTDPADRPKAETAVRDLAEIGGVRIRHVLWVNSPKEGATAAATGRRFGARWQRRGGSSSRIPVVRSVRSWTRSGTVAATTVARQAVGRICRSHWTRWPSGAVSSRDGPAVLRGQGDDDRDDGEGESDMTEHRGEVQPETSAAGQQIGLLAVGDKMRSNDDPADRAHG